jgi:hypothetical protein
MKFHLLNSPEPLKQGEDHKAQCGAVVKDSIFAAQIDESAASGNVNIQRLMDSFRGVCRKCLKQPLTSAYIYAARESAQGLEITDEDSPVATKPCRGTGVADEGMPF